MDLLDQITVEDLDGGQRELAEVIGIEAYRKLVAYYGGNEPYVAKADSLIKPIRNRLIAREFNGDNSFHISRKWQLSERRIRDLTKDKLKEIKTRPVDGQIKFF